MFPMNLTTVYHKSGGTITHVHSIGHTCDKPQEGRSRDYWYFIADVEWRDGTKSEKTEVAPYALCAEDPGANPEIAALMEAMNAYLAEHGEWFHKGKHQGWYANRKERVTA